MNIAHPNAQPNPNRVRRGAIGIITRGDTYLMIRRASDIAMGGCWCFPGGHVERGETPRQAIQRELYEELGIEVVPTERIGSVRVGTQYVLAIWRVQHVRGQLTIARDEIADVRWLNPSEIRAVQPNIPSNEQVLKMLNV